MEECLGQSGGRTCLQRAGNCGHALGQAGCSNVDINDYCSGGGGAGSITCGQIGDQLEFYFPAGGIFPGRSTAFKKMIIRASDFPF